MAAGCTGPPNCTLCAEKGLKALHRMGGPVCPLANKKAPSQRTTKPQKTGEKKPSAGKSKTKKETEVLTAHPPPSSTSLEVKTTSAEKEGQEEAMDIEPNNG